MIVMMTIEEDWLKLTCRSGCLMPRYGNEVVKMRRKKYRCTGRRKEVWRSGDSKGEGEGKLEMNSYQV